MVAGPTSQRLLASALSDLRDSNLFSTLTLGFEKLVYGRFAIMAGV